MILYNQKFNLKKISDLPQTKLQINFEGSITFIKPVKGLEFLKYNIM